MATNFGLTVSSPQVNIIQSLNYLLATQANAASSVVNYNGNVLVANTTTGAITSVYSNGASQTGTISYLYGYVDVKYSNSATGGSGFTSNCQYANYYGVYNNNTGIESSNPVNYQWTQVAGGFGNTRTLWYTTGGGNTINFSVANAAPSIYYEPVIDNVPILLAIVANSAVITNSIAPAAITNVQVAGNTITGYNIQLGTITANLLAVGTIIVANSIQSNNAIFGNYQSPGYWLDSSSGNVRFGGNVSIGNNLTVGNNAVIGGNVTINGIVTSGNINANVVTTTALQTQSATTVVNTVGEQNVNPVTFVNGNTSVYGQPGYLWPTNTRGFGSAGATIIPTTNGSVAGSQITVNWNTFINTLQYSSYNLIELWKNGQSYFYQNNLQRITCALQLNLPGSGVTGVTDMYTATGLNGSLLVYNYPIINPANPGTWYSGGTPNQTGNVQSLSSGTTSSLYSQISAFAAINGSDNTYFGATSVLPNLDSSIPFFSYAAVPIAQSVSSAPPTYGFNSVVVGAGGQIMRVHYSGNGPGTNSYTTSSYVSETSGVLADLYDVAIGTSTTSSTSVLTVAVGTGGTILTTSRSYLADGDNEYQFSSQTGWVQQGSNTSFNLNAVCSNWQGGISKWVAVGDYGTIVTAGASASGWTVQNSGTTNPLYGVAYSGGRWTVVGANGIILTSTDTVNWSQISSPYPGRDLYSICVGIQNSSQMVACGQEIMIQSTNSGVTFSNLYVGGSSLASNLTRLQYYGSWANIATQDEPPAQQQIANGQIVSGSYTDSNYVAGNPQVYYVVVGSLTGNTTIYSSQTSLTVTEFKR